MVSLGIYVAINKTRIVPLQSYRVDLNMETQLRLLRILRIYVYQGKRNHQLPFFYSWQLYTKTDIAGLLINL